MRRASRPTPFVDLHQHRFKLVLFLRVTFSPYEQSSSRPLSLRIRRSIAVGSVRLSTAFTQSVREKVDTLGRGTPQLTCEFEYLNHFDSAHVTFNLDGMKLHAVSEKGVESLEI